MVRIKSGSAFRNLADTQEKITKTITGCSRFIEGQNVISAKIMPKKRTGKKTYFSYKKENPFFFKKNLLS